MTEPLRMVIFGRQGAGKGTQCLRLVERFGVVHISTGDMLRHAVAAGTELGLRAKAVMDAGELVGDDLINGIVAERLTQLDVGQQGFVLDGYPRTVGQAKALLDILGEPGLHAAVDLDVPLEVVTARMQARGREDDTTDAIARRLEIYERETRPVLDFFTQRDLLVTVDGVGTEDEVSSRLFEAVEAARR